MPDEIMHSVAYEIGEELVPVVLIQNDMHMSASRS